MFYRMRDWETKYVLKAMKTEKYKYELNLSIINFEILVPTVETYAWSDEFFMVP
jgi:hypothetical protein